MKIIHVATGLMALLGIAGAQELPAKQEIGLTLGGVFKTDRAGGASKLSLGSGLALQANYGYRLLATDKVALYGEVHFLASPLRDVTSADRTLTRDVASAFVTPGVRVKFYGGKRVAPYATVGGGWALYENSTATIDGRANPASRFVNRGAFTYGGGVDVKFWKFVGLRGEVRDFYTGSPAYNARTISGGQHNVVAGGGIVLRLR